MLVLLVAASVVRPVPVVRPVTALPAPVTALSAPSLGGMSSSLGVPGPSALAATLPAPALSPALAHAPSAAPLTAAGASLSAEPRATGRRESPAVRVVPPAAADAPRVGPPEPAQGAGMAGADPATPATARRQLAPAGGVDGGRVFDGSGPRQLVEANLPDPAIVRAGRDYFLTGTSNRAPDAFPLLRSRDLERWTEAGHIFPAGKRPAWTKPDGFFWAPEIHRVGGRYLVYYTAQDRAGKLALGAAWAEKPTGPWTDLGRPMLKNPAVGLIDGHPFRDRDGRMYFYWKEDSNDPKVGKPTAMLVRELTSDGLGFKGRARRVLLNDLSWEGELIEGPWVLRRGGWYYLIYSANAFFDHRYAVGVARSRSPLGPFEKKGDPILVTDEHWIGPGHGMVLRRRGRDHYVYHAWHPGRAGGKDLFTSAFRPPYPEGEFPRVPLIRRLRWKGGWPYFPD